MCFVRFLTAIADVESSIFREYNKQTAKQIQLAEKHIKLLSDINYVTV